MKFLLNSIPLTVVFIMGSAFTNPNNYPESKGINVSSNSIVWIGQKITGSHTGILN